MQFACCGTYTIECSTLTDRRHCMTITPALHFLIVCMTWPLRSTQWCFAITHEWQLRHCHYIPMLFIIRVIVTFVHETNGICLTSVEKTHVWNYKEWDCVAQLRNKYHLLYVRVFTSSEDRCNGALYCLCLEYFKIKWYTYISSLHNKHAHDKHNC